MSKAITASLTLTILLVLSSAISTKTTDSRVGYLAPNLTIRTDDNDQMLLQQMHGQYVLLTLWASYNPQSRLDNLHYDRLASHSGAFRHIAICCDSSSRLFEQLRQADRLNPDTQFHRSQIGGKSLQDDYRLNTSGYRTLLVSPQGEIVSVNPTDQELASLR